MRKDADGMISPHRSWESLTERQIREAQERGDFDGLPLQGKPLPNRSNPWAGDMALAYDMLRDAGVAPPWIEADKDARTWLAKRDAIIERGRRSGPPMRRTLHREMAEAIQRYNQAVLRVNATAPGPRQHRRPMTLNDDLAALDAAIDSAAEQGTSR